MIVTGTRKTHGENELKNTEFQNIQEHYWQRLLEERRRSAINRRKFQGMKSLHSTKSTFVYDWSQFLAQIKRNENYERASCTLEVFEESSAPYKLG